MKPGRPMWWWILGGSTIAGGIGLAIARSGKKQDGDLTTPAANVMNGKDFAQKLTGISAIDALGLIEPALSGAVALYDAIPGITFTSGRRSKESQAAAMAGRVATDRQWITKTYVSTPERAQLQAAVDALPDGADQVDIRDALLGVMSGWTDAQLGKITRHAAGLAFDLHVDPNISEDDIKGVLAGVDGFDKFLDNEGGQKVWHAQFKPPAIPTLV